MIATPAARNGRPFNPLTFDYNSAAAARGNLASVTAPTNMDGRIVIASGAGNVNGPYTGKTSAAANSYPNGGSILCIDVFPALTSSPPYLADLSMACPLRTENAVLSGVPVIERVTLGPTAQQEGPMGSLAGAFNLWQGILRNSIAIGSIHGITGQGGNYSSSPYFSFIDTCKVYFTPAQQCVYGGYPWDQVTAIPVAAAPQSTATTGLYLPGSVQSALTDWSAGETVAAGTAPNPVLRVATKTGQNPYLLQCTAGGSSGTGSGSTPDGFNSIDPNGFYQLGAGEVAQPYTLTGGTAKWITMGIEQHTDCMAFFATSNVTVLRCFMHGPDNDSCAVIIQSSGASSDSKNMPVKLITVQDSWLQTDGGGFVAWVQVNCLGNIPAYGSSGGSVYPGRYLWNSGSGWSANSQAYLSRPVFISFRNCTFGDQLGNIAPTNTTCLSSGSRFNDNAIIVASETVRDAGIAAQYGITVAQVQAMKASNYDWTAVPAVNTAVLETRRNTFNAVAVPDVSDGGGHQGVCDACSWIVWDGCYTQAGVPLYPGANPWAGVTGFDANGFYTGI
jgi:hypothetical protein